MEITQRCITNNYIPNVKNNNKNNC